MRSASIWRAGRGGQSGRMSPGMACTGFPRNRGISIQCCLHVICGHRRQIRRNNRAVSDHRSASKIARRYLPPDIAARWLRRLRPRRSPASGRDLSQRISCPVRWVGTERMQLACVCQHAVGSGRVRCRRILPGGKEYFHLQPAPVGDAELLLSASGRRVDQDRGDSVDRHVLAGSLRARPATVSCLGDVHLEIVDVGEADTIAWPIVEMQRLRHRLASEQGVVHL